MRHLERGFVALNAAVIVALLLAMAVVVGWNVSLRYLTSQSLPWADEVARYAMIWLGFLGAGLALREGAHVAITNLHDVLPRRGAVALRALLLAGLMAFFLFMVWTGWDYMSRTAFQKSPALRLPMRWVYAAMPVGFGLLALHLALIAPRYLRAGLGAADHPEEAARG
ncbi:TRAP transporter small permease [Paracoccus jiaweipingae]|uniref:TRAP transporter small permease n=1 Tax=unclassified Paracoccus (in: a-proteobacteria) TaxID=2688777 RepID=UPI0037BD4892